MADQLLFETSNESQVTSEPFISRQVVYVIDQNNGNYSGQIQLDTSSLSNSGKFASFSEAYLQVPIVCAWGPTSASGVGAGTLAELQAAFTAATIPFGIGLKNGFHNLIHSISVEYNNTNVIQLTPYSNFHVSYKLMTTLSEGDVKKVGPTIGFVPDSSIFAYNTAASATDKAGRGVTNCRNFEDTTVALTTWDAEMAAKANKGYLNRQMGTSVQLSAAPSSTFITEANGEQQAFNLYEKKDAYNHVWYIMATIRLKDMHDFFDKMPLVKGSYLRFIINVNTATHTLTFAKTGVAGAGNVNIAQESATVASNGTSPFIIASGEANQGLAPLFTAITANCAANTAFTSTLSIGIGKVTINNTTYTHQAFQAQTRLYVPLYTMNPVNMEQYLSLNRQKKIVYRDIYQYQTNVDAAGTFNALLTNGIPNPKNIIIIPFIRDSANPLNAAGTGTYTYPYLSPWASEPSTTSPLIALRNFNIQLAGVNMFIQNEDYDFEQFINELSPVNAINGGLVDGLTSGLISKNDFTQRYRYYVCDVSRRLPAEDSVPKSVQILGLSKCNLAISLYTFIEFERSVTIDLETGQLLQ